MAYVPPGGRPTTAYVPPQGRTINTEAQSTTFVPTGANQPVLEAMTLFQHQPVKVEKKELTIQELSTEYLKQFQSAKFSTKQKPKVISEQTQKALTSRNVERKQKAPKNMELTDAGKSNLLQLHNVALDIQKDIDEKKPIHVILQNYILYTQNTHLPMYIDTYRSDIIITTMSFIGLLFESRQVNIIYKVLDTVKGVYFKFFPQIQEEILNFILVKTLDLVTLLPEKYTAKIQNSLIFYNEKLSGEEDTIFFIFSLTFKVMQFAATCFYPTVFCEACSKLMMISVTFARYEELQQIIDTAEQFSWEDNFYDDYSSAYVQKLVYLLRADMISALLAVADYENCYKLLVSTSSLVKVNLEQQFVDIDDIHIELLRLVKLSIKYFSLTNQYLYQAQCQESFIRLSIAFNIDVDQLQNYADEAVILINCLPHILSKNFVPNFMLTANYNFSLTTQVQDISYMFISDTIAPSQDIYNLMSLKQGVRSKIYGSVNSYVKISNELISFLTVFCQFPQYFQDPEMYLQSAKAALQSYSASKFTISLVAFADKITEKFFTNAIALFLIQSIQTGKNNLKIDEISQFVLTQLQSLYPNDEINVPTSSLALVRLILPLVKLPIFANSNIKFSLISREFTFRQAKLIKTKQEFDEMNVKFTQISDFKPQQSKFYNSGILCDALKLVKQTHKPAHLTALNFAEIIVKNKLQIAETELKKRKEFEEKQNAEMKLSEQRDKELKKLAEIKQEADKMKRVFTDIITKHILSRANDDEELSVYLKSINLSNLKPIQWQGELMKKEAEFNRKRLQDRQNLLNSQTQKVEAQIYYIRQLQIEERKNTYMTQVEGLNQMLKEIVPIRFEQETASFEASKTLKLHLADIGDYQLLVTEQKTKFDEYYDEEAAIFEQKVEELAAKLKAESDAEKAKILSQEEAEKQKAELELEKMRQKSLLEAKKVAETKVYRPGQGSGAYVPGGNGSIYRPGQGSGNPYVPKSTVIKPAQGGAYVPQGKPGIYVPPDARK
ncbi:hypothetical protein SS50377_26564 [Spironucleus salmonicida]|uniref:Uncharacterized protein n=1 Tax=Spironucleus salmonicida TaxID=348837 RepID=V6LB14_9EUKA|nr:hypothetical protein SS50377_26564 [Spironucleus salmonicida]|eukprot:EST41418.1 Hypothetical protein SS50377_19135 [Spironucleus salmonicida]